MLRAVTLGALLCAIVLVAVLIFGGSSGHQYKLEFQTAGQIVPGNLVMVGGHPVGSVKSVGLTPDNQAEVVINVDDELHEDTSAIIRHSSLSSVANHYISLTPGPDNNKVLADDAVIGQGQTTTAVDLDQFFDTFDARSRKGLSNWIQGVAAIYAGDAAEGANGTFKYTGAAFSSTQRLFGELAKQDTGLKDFVKNTSGVVTSLAEKSDQLTSLVSNSNQALGAIASENQSLSLALQELPPTLRQANTTFVNLRAALDDVEPLIAANNRAADAGLAAFLKNDLRPVLVKAKPVFSNLATAAVKPGANNDTSDLLTNLIPLHPKATPAVNAVVGGLDASQEDVADARAYAPDIFNAFARLGADAAPYDANGHYISVRPTASNLFQFNGATIAPNTGSVYGGMTFNSNFARCPGGSTQAIAGSNPFLDNGNLTGKCDPSQVIP